MNFCKNLRKFAKSPDFWKKSPDFSGNFRIFLRFFEKNLRKFQNFSVVTLHKWYFWWFLICIACKVKSSKMLKKMVLTPWEKYPPFSILKEPVPCDVACNNVLFYQKNIFESFKLENWSTIELKESDIKLLGADSQILK